MPTVRQIAGNTEISAPEIRNTPPRRLTVVRSGISAIEYIVENAQPGEVIHIAEEDYYNPYLWRSYLDAEDLN